jgi:hypothetical protein
VGRFQGLLHGCGKAAGERGQVDGALQPGGEGADDPVRVVTGPVEPAVDRVLHSSPDRVD